MPGCFQCDFELTGISAIWISASGMLGLKMKAAKDEKASMGMLETDFTTPDCLQEVEIDKKLQEICLRMVSPESPAKLYCSYVLNIILTAAVIALSVALSVRTEKPVISTLGPCYPTCPSGWIGLGNKCFHFSEDMRNWTFSQTSCMALGAQLAQFDSLEELNFLKRYVGNSFSWIDLQRESTQHPWKWTDNTEYNNLYVFRPLFFLLCSCVVICEL